MDYKYEEFLDRLYKDLHMSDVVMHTASKSDNKNEKIKKYMDRLEKVHELASNGKYDSDVEKLKSLYYAKYVIKEEDIPSSYYEYQKQFLLERGHGYVEITDKKKKELNETLINDQKASLGEWIDYFLIDDSKFYPFELKYWAFQGMLNLGSYDKKTEKFNKRTKSTTSKFVDLNREALALAISDMDKFLNGQKMTDELLDKLLENGSFGKIYAYNLAKLEKIKKSNNSSNDGVWVKYSQGGDHIPLVKSLEGKGTGWCTAGESTAKTQLKNGDFYVYYTKGDSLEYTEPRIAIRMDGKNKIGEIRGVAEKQNLESEMDVVLEEKLKEFPDRDNYLKKVSDMKKLTSIYNKTKKNDELTVEELRFLYEIDEKIIGFGYEKDPRIKEIINNRNMKKDLSLVFDCREEQIGLSKEDLGRDLVCYWGDLDLSSLTSVEGLKLPKMVYGSLILGSLISAEGLTLPSEIVEILNLNSLESAEGLVFPEKIGGSLYLDSLKSAEGVTLPKEIGGGLYLESLKSAEGLVLPEKIGGDLNLRSLESAKNLTFPDKIFGNLDLRSLESAKDLTLSKEIGGDLNFSSLKSAKDLTLPNEIGGDLILESLESAKDLTLPNEIGGDLILESLESAEGLVFPKNVRYIDLSSLTIAKDLIFPEKVVTLELSSLLSANNVIFPEDIDWLYLGLLRSVKCVTFPGKIFDYLILESLESAEGLTLPKELGGDLDLSSLKIAKDLTLPNEIGGNLILESLESAEGLTLPKEIGGDLDLSSLKIAKDLTLPNEIGGNLDLSSLDSVEGLTLPKEIGGSLGLSSLKNAKCLTLPNEIGGNLYLESLESTESLNFPEKIGGRFILPKIDDLGQGGRKR